MCLMAYADLHDDGDASHREGWCLECIQGKNPVRELYDIPLEWNR
jgi:hypothetical protein